MQKSCQNNDHGSPWRTPDEAAEFLGVPVRRLARLRQRGVVSFSRPTPRIIRFHIDELERVLPLIDRRTPGFARDFFNAHVMEPSDGCRDWPYSISNGYGQVSVGGRQRRVHVLTCERWHGPCPEGMQASHTCGRSICWAGEHLLWEPPVDNMRRQFDHGTRNRRTQP